MYVLYALLSALMILSALTDLLYGKIFNMVTVPVFFLGIGIRVFYGGPEVLPAAVLTAVTPFLILYPFWRLTNGKGIGGGDIKLLMAAAACLSPEDLLPVGLLIFGSAAVFGMFRLISEVVRAYGHRERFLPGNPAYAVPGTEERKGIHLACFAALGTMLYIIGQLG